MQKTTPFRQYPKIIRHLASAWLGAILLCLAACQSIPEQSSVASHPPRANPPAETVRYAIIPDLSEARFLVFRAGPMAKLGHNHVVQAKNIRGEIRLAVEIHQSSFSIEIPVGELQVDAKEARLEEGEEFLPQPTDEAIAGTARNMLGEKVLDATRYPSIEIESVAMTGPAWGMDITARIRLHGVEREIVVPTAIEKNGERLLATALFRINQTDFGITPLSILGGAIQVDNSVKVRMRIVAEKDNSPARPQ